MEILLVLLEKHEAKLLTLLQAGFFDMSQGSVTVHFRQDGSIGKIERHDSITFS